MKKLFNKFYLDKEKDIIVNLYQTSQDEITYILETPNHKKGTFVSNTGRKAKNTQDIMIFSKGKARNMRYDKKRTTERRRHLQKARM